MDLKVYITTINILNRMLVWAETLLCPDHEHKISETRGAMRALSLLDDEHFGFPDFFNVIRENKLTLDFSNILFGFLQTSHQPLVEYYNLTVQDIETLIDLITRP
jgi:hypothetical protein